MAQRRAGRSATALIAFFAITLCVFAADQALKYYAFHYVPPEPIELNEQKPGHTYFPNHEVPVVDGLLSLRLTANTGAVFGLGDGMQWLFIAVSIIAAGIILRLFWVSPANAWVSHLALALILAGDLGNLYDRVMFSAVRDMLYLFPGVELPFGLAWPNGAQKVWPWLFNIADAALMVGVGLVLVVIWGNQRPQQTGESAQD
jgi:signal peptidase II